jgi:hypothetical protein
MGESASFLRSYWPLIIILRYVSKSVDSNHFTFQQSLLLSHFKSPLT